MIFVMKRSRQIFVQTPTSAAAPYAIEGVGTLVCQYADKIDFNVRCRVIPRDPILAQVLLYFAALFRRFLCEWVLVLHPLGRFFLHPPCSSFASRF